MRKGRCRIRANGGVSGVSADNMYESGGGGEKLLAQAKMRRLGVCDGGAGAE